MLSFAVIFSGLMGCASTSEMADMSSRLSMDSGLGAQRYIIRSASIGLEVGDVKASTQLVNELVSTNAGFVVSVSSFDESSTNISVKVPEPKLDSFIKSLASIGKVTSQSMYSRDVTEEIVDIDSRIKNLHLLRDRYRELLKDAKNVTEVVGIEKELADIQSELDRIEGRRKLLMGQVEMSEVTISLEPRTIYGPLGYLGKGIWWAVEKLFVIK